MPVICPYCHNQASLTTGAEVYPRHPDLAANKIWICRPCEAWVRCHSGTDRPLGQLADGKLRAARQAGHRAFDPLWEHMWRVNGGSKEDARGIAYGWLAEQLGVLPADCHFAGFSYEQCLKATLLCRELLVQLDVEIQDSQSPLL